MCFFLLLGTCSIPVLLFFGSVSRSSNSSPYFPRSSGSQSSLIYQPTINPPVIIGPNQIKYECSSQLY